ncbi:MAG: carbamate kinase [Sphaerochaetaceae bacterium]|nr:carbamate kinase [Sphaerochaetaceae bacterium]MDD3162823.1 carbamate kinase [Sphaerochaetaceae bacterium]MDD4007136.1 carbamate kinase [Sphaerochaetaceae bacterium]MDD4397209.1 carbamate kinase [Sphaerochaetaceae bacterium]
MESKLIVIAIGGNSLIEDPKHVSVSAQYEAARKTAAHIARLIKEGHRVVIAHGNGPQVGFILLRAEYSIHILHPVPLDSCVADTQGAIGYQLQMALRNELGKIGCKAEVATVVTQVEVSPTDPSFGKPTKPIGSFMTAEDAEQRVKEHGWTVVEDAGRGYRRVVPSPKPIEIVELQTVKTLLDNGVIVIAAGGGGIPVCRQEDGTLKGLEAVIDKDYAASLMARRLHADLFVISTAVPEVCLNYGKPDQKQLSKMTLAEAAEYTKQGQFAPGSMLPKVNAMADFVRETGNIGIITDPEDLYDAVYSGRGTRMVP